MTRRWIMVSIFLGLDNIRIKYVLNLLVIRKLVVLYFISFEFIACFLNFERSWLIRLIIGLFIRWFSCCKIAVFVHKSGAFNKLLVLKRIVPLVEGLAHLLFSVSLAVFNRVIRPTARSSLSFLYFDISVSRFSENFSAYFSWCAWLLKIYSGPKVMNLVSVWLAPTLLMHWALLVRVCIWRIIPVSWSILLLPGSKVLGSIRATRKGIGSGLIVVVFISCAVTGIRVTIVVWHNSLLGFVVEVSFTRWCVASKLIKVSERKLTLMKTGLEPSWISFYASHAFWAASMWSNKIQA